MFGKCESTHSVRHLKLSTFRYKTTWLHNGIRIESHSLIISNYYLVCQASRRICMKYKIVCDKHEFEFENKINLLLEQGWRLHGEIVVNLVSSDQDLTCWYTQSMIKDD